MITTRASFFRANRPPRRVFSAPQPEKGADFAVFGQNCCKYRDYSIDIPPPPLYPSHLSGSFSVGPKGFFARTSMAENKTKAATKSAIFQELSEKTGLSRK